MVCGRLRGEQPLFQAERGQVLREDNGVQMHRCTSVIVLARKLPLAILELEMGSKVQAAAPPVWQLGVQEDLTPKRAAFSVLPGAADDPFAQKLHEDVGQVERLERGQVLPGAKQSCQVMQQRLVIRRAPFVGRPGLEQDRVPTLPLEIQDGSVPHGPIGSGERGTLEQDTHGHLRANVALGAEVRPPSQVEHEVQQLVVARKVQNGPKQLLQIAPSSFFK